MSRETEVAARLRADAELASLLPGGIYSAATLGDMGITDPATTPDAWVGGVFQPSAIVRQRTLVPTGEVVDLKDQHASASQVVEVYVYARDAMVIEPAQERIYALLQGHVLPRAWPCQWANAVGPVAAPELAGAHMARMDFQIVSIRRP